MSDSKLSSFLAELSSVLEADDIPESGEVGLSCGEDLSVRRYFGAQPENNRSQFLLKLEKIRLCSIRNHFRLVECCCCVDLVELLFYPLNLAQDVVERRRRREKRKIC